MWEDMGQVLIKRNEIVVIIIADYKKGQTKRSKHRCYIGIQEILLYEISFLLCCVVLWIGHIS